MSDNAFPMPTEIRWDNRQAGTLVITPSDRTDGLRLIGNYFRDSLTHSMLDHLKSNVGVKIMVFTPAGAFIDVTMKHKPKPPFHPPGHGVEEKPSAFLFRR
ncbi:hypothetical protein Patl1_22608 [Pistacia atlantica]|uniref:Uncharacterized protein n=1 Tax=Pistacia atlantica TaxID=434234 RepID=A0ACC0ZYJ3_9ROSI|nr:hypothetical protein Patl1_22608 [Pistacia atlantica]